jgi:hypothetical protein
VPSPSICILFLCHRPTVEQLIFYGQFVAAGYAVTVIVDDSTWPVAQIHGIEILLISDEASLAAGFLGVNPAVRKILPVSAWDKALFFIYHTCKVYDHYWLIEDDVFIASPESLLQIDLSQPSVDLISATSTVVTAADALTSTCLGWPWFKHVPRHLLPLPWSSGMVCAVRLSAHLAAESAQLVQSHATALDGRNRQRRWLASVLVRCHVPWPLVERVQRPSYLFIEYLFHTLALHLDLEVRTPEQLSTILWRHEWQPEAMLPSHLYHPVKAINDHPRLREQIFRRQS